MSKVILQVDGNNFYASCEQMIDPSIKGKGLVVLSNNEGCIIARSSEARRMGIPMGQPYFKLKNKLTQLNINVRSSNYELYGDISNRLMSLLRKNCEELEVYSIDEAFGSIKRPKNKCLYKWAKDLRALVYQNIGIPISIGMGETKTLSKVSNHFAKRIKSNSGIFDIGIIENKDPYLNQINVDDVWGIGKKMSVWLKRKGISNALELKNMPSNDMKVKYGVVGLRIQNELKGNLCIPIKEIPSDRKQICISRTFSYPIDSLEELNKVIIKYVLIATNKLRKSNQLASAISVFANTNSHSTDFFKGEATEKINIPTSNSKIIIEKSKLLTKKIFKSYNKFIKAGIILHKLQGNENKQKLIFEVPDIQEELYREKLDYVIDNINARNGINTIGWGSSIIEKEWSPCRKKLSSMKTTNIESIATIYAN